MTILRLSHMAWSCAGRGRVRLLDIDFPQPHLILINREPTLLSYISKIRQAIDDTYWVTVAIIESRARDELARFQPQKNQEAHSISSNKHLGIRGLPMPALGQKRT